MTAEGSTKMRARRMEAADLGRVMEIAGALAEAPHWPEWAFRAALAAAGEPRRIALAAEDAGGVAGFAVAGMVDTEAELETIVVEAGRQRQGVGTLLLMALAEELRAAGVKDLFLEVRASNQRALEFYRRMGFAEIGRRVRYYADPVEDAVLQRLRLG